MNARFFSDILHSYLYISAIWGSASRLNPKEKYPKVGIWWFFGLNDPKARSQAAPGPEPLGLNTKHWMSQPGAPALYLYESPGSKACLPLLRFDDPLTHFIGLVSGFFPCSLCFPWACAFCFCPVALSVCIVVRCSLDDNDDGEVEKGFSCVSTSRSTRNQKSSTWLVVLWLRKRVMSKEAVG